MFNPIGLDEVCVQATHLEARGKNTFDALNEDSDFKSKGKKGLQIPERKKGNSFARTVQKQGTMNITVGSFILS